MTDHATQNAAAAAQHTRRITGPTMLFCDGLYFDFEAPDATGMTIEDYVWSLASKNRFNGLTRYSSERGRPIAHRRCLYNVAQHCVLLAHAMLCDGHPAAAVYEGLMHESDEVPWPDIAGPAKPLLHPETRALI